MRTLASLDSVSKVYPRVHQPLERLQAFGSLLIGKEPKLGAEVLSDVSLEIVQGESLPADSCVYLGAEISILLDDVSPVFGLVFVFPRFKEFPEDFDFFPLNFGD